MTKRKQKQQENRYKKDIEPLLDKLSELCDKYDMPLLATVQLYDETDKGTSRVCVQTAGDEDVMAFPMWVSVAIMRGKLKINSDADSMTITLTPENINSQMEHLTEHAKECEDCAEIMEVLISQGEDVSNIMVPAHSDDLDDLSQIAKMPIVIPTKPIIH